MIPYLLLVLLLSLPTQACDEHTACLYLITCFIESQLVPDTTKMQPTVNVTTNIDEAVEGKRNCSGFGFVSTLSILSTSNSSWNISFETDLNVVGFTLGVWGEKNFLRFKTHDEGIIAVGKSDEHKVIDHSKGLSIGPLGRATHSFTVEHPDELKTLIGQPISLLLGDHGDQTFDVSSTDFWKDFEAKLACDGTAIRDSCGNQTNCNQVLVSSHSLGCVNSSELWLSSSSGSWFFVSSAECRDQQWKLRNGTEEVKTEKEINVECREPASSTTLDSDASSDVDDVSDSPVVPIAQKAKEETTAAPPAPEEKKEEEKSFLHDNKWYLIGGVGALIIVIIILVIVLCLVCRKRNKNKAKKKQSKTAKRNKNNKGGKRHPDSSSAQPSSSESKLDPSAGTVQSSNPPPSSESVMQPATVKPGMTTEMNLDVLKTEMII